MPGNYCPYCDQYYCPYFHDRDNPRITYTKDTVWSFLPTITPLPADSPVLAFHLADKDFCLYQAGRYAMTLFPSARLCVSTVVGGGEMVPVFDLFPALAAHYPARLTHAAYRRSMENDQADVTLADLYISTTVLQRLQRE